ncbi:TPA: acylglycerol kinase family protein [Streptococcus pneumoniae]|nr:sphingosine kinase [Streptococcus pneumoniae]VOR80590.1 sphingosine kinase [Streptococcus pneumoniae]VOT42622.1 sphingosine kinase [Streptococcus pneumoniae]VOU26123.1 sphingosine kinase [Streptococcus pneumoniae]VOV10645.1 sphingosine kinase [Streptococcus pneumoniae]
MKKAMVIINPTSGGEKALDYKEKLENKAKEYFEYVETKITEKALDATHFAEEASREQYDAVVVFGGDGTVNEVISGIDERDYIPKLGIIPGGTGNLITKLLEINQDIDGAIDELDFDLTNKIDIGKANDNIEYIKARNIKISSDSELESDVDGDKSDNLPVEIKVLAQRVEVFSKPKED